MNLAEIRALHLGAPSMLAIEVAISQGKLSVRPRPFVWRPFGDAFRYLSIPRPAGAVPNDPQAA